MRPSPGTGKALVISALMLTSLTSSQGVYYDRGAAPRRLNSNGGSGGGKT